MRFLLCREGIACARLLHRQGATQLARTRTFLSSQRGPAQQQVTCRRSLLGPHTDPGVGCTLRLSASRATVERECRHFDVATGTYVELFYLAAPSAACSRPLLRESAYLVGASAA